MPEIQIERLESFLKDTFPVEVEIKNNFFKDKEDSFFEKIASTRIYDLKKTIFKTCFNNY